MNSCNYAPWSCVNILWTGMANVLFIFCRTKLYEVWNIRILWLVCMQAMPFWCTKQKYLSCMLIWWCLDNEYCLQDFIESLNGLSWKEPQGSSSSNPQFGAIDKIVFAHNHSPKSHLFSTLFLLPNNEENACAYSVFQWKYCLLDKVML